MHKRHIILILVICILNFCATAFADSTARLVDKGNKSWLAGKYDEAIKSYDEAAVDNPESPYIYFNKGTALYKKGDYKGAIEAFEKAELKSKEPVMEAKSRFNMGNCSYRQAERQMDSDLKKALDYCQKSVQHYQDALNLDPNFKAAAENMEIVRLRMKNILDEIKKKEEEAKKRQQQAQQNAQDLQKLIKRQENALEKNKKLSAGKMKPDEKKKSLNQLADEQKAIKDDTQKLADKIKNQSAQQKQKGSSPALTHLNNAVKEQEAAEGNLRNSASSHAEKNQQNAVNELKEALKPPDKNGNKQGQGGKNEEQQQKQQGQQKNQNKSGKDKSSQDQKQTQQKQEQARLKKADEDAQEILNEEKENKKERRMRASGGYSDVDKDW